MARISTFAIVALIAGCAPPPPRHGGTLVPIELAVHASGELVVSLPRDVAPSDSGVTVTLRDSEGRAHSIATHRVGPLFVGRLEEGTTPTRAAEVLVLQGGELTRRSIPIRILPPPEHGGSMLWLEGPIEASVDVAGRARVYAPEGSELTLGVPSEGGQLPLALSWDSDCGCYTGQLEGMTPEPGPLTVIDGNRRAHGLLREIAPDPMAIPPAPELQLEMPELGSDLPPVITIPTE